MTWNGSQIQIYTWKPIKCKQTADCKQTAESKQTDNFIKIECTWNGSQVQIYSWKLIKCKQTADCKQRAESKQIFLSFLKYYTGNLIIHDS